MFDILIVVIGLIISMIAMLLVYNISDRLFYALFRHKIQYYPKVQGVYIGVLLVLLCILEYDLVYGFYLWLHL